MPANVVTGGDKPGSFKLPGTDTSVKIGGYVKGDLIYDINADTGDSFAASGIPAEGTPTEEGSFRAHARQSRVNLTTWTPTGAGEVTTRIEGDFFGAGGNQQVSNSTSFRLRHAYGQLSGKNVTVLAGQTWSNFMPMTVGADVIDFAGPTGIPFIRQGQLRLTFDAGENLEVSVSAENSDLSANSAAGGIESDRGALQFGIDTLPDFTGKVTYNGAAFSGELAALGRLLETTGATSDDSEFGWGLNASAAIPIGGDNLQVSLTYGDGVGRYILGGFHNDAFVDALGNLDTQQTWGAVGAYTHHWTDTTRSNVVYGHYDAGDTFAPTDTASLDTIHLNFIWAPAPRVDFGIEYIYGMRSFANGALDNDASRLHFGAKYAF